MEVQVETPKNPPVQTQYSLNLVHKARPEALMKLFTGFLVSAIGTTVHRHKPSNCTTVGIHGNRSLGVLVG